jgi:hypothetical protein
MTLQVVTANKLDDGLAVFYNENGNWVSSIADATALEKGEAADKLLAQSSDDANQLLVVGPYLIDVEENDGTFIPVRYREMIRTKGPSVRPDLGYQAQ